MDTAIEIEDQFIENICLTKRIMPELIPVKNNASRTKIVSSQNTDDSHLTEMMVHLDLSKKNMLDNANNGSKRKENETDPEISGKVLTELITQHSNSPMMEKPILKSTDPCLAKDTSTVSGITIFI